MFLFQDYKFSDLSYNESMALKLWLGNAGSGKSHQVYEEVIREAQLHKDRTYLVIVPEQFTLQTQRDLVRMHPDGGILNIDVLSFARLSYRVFEEIGFAKAPGLLIDDMGKNLILRHLAGEVEDRLKVIGKNLKKLGYITEVKSVISEFMQYGVDAQAIARLQEISRQNNRRLLSEKLEDCALLYETFRNYIAEKYTTTEELLVCVSSALADSEKLARSVIVLDGFTGFTPVQYDLIRALMQKCIDVHVTVLLDTLREADVLYDTEELFFLSRKTIRELKHIAEKSDVPVLPDHVIRDEIPYRFRDGNPGMLIHLEKNLFRPDSVSCDKISDDIQIFSAPNPMDEMAYAAICIQRLIREKNYRYKDIAIVSGDPDTYMHAASRVFTRYGIPFFIDKKQPVLQNPFIEYMRAILRILTEDYSHEGMFAYLKSSMADVDASEVDLLENYCIACGIHGAKQWKNRFLRCPSSLTIEQVMQLDALRERIVAPFAVFDGVETVRDYCTALFEMLKNADAQHKLSRMQRSFTAAGLDVKAKEYELIYPSVLSLLDKLVELLGDEKMDAEDFCELLDAGFAELRVGAIPARTDYVQIGDLTRSRFGDIKALFFVGVNDGIIPQSPGGGGLISDLDREFFADKLAGVSLAPSARQQAYIQRLYLYMVMTKPTEHLFLSFAAVSDAGTSMMPSYLIGEMQTMFPQIRTSAYESLQDTEKAFTDETAFTELASNLQDLTQKEEKKSPEAKKLLEYFIQNEQYRDKLKSMINTAFLDNGNRLTNSVGDVIAHVIYGSSIQGSVTRLETYAKCAYEHFLKYGLRLKEREEFSFEAKDMGSVFHGALETFSKLMSEEGLTWDGLNDETSDRIAEEAVKRTVVGYDAVYASFRSSYMTTRINRILKRSVRILRAQILAGDFVPSRFELDFSGRRDLSAIHFRLSEEDTMHLAGRIDRMDLYEDNDRIYVKIIDYKSGNRSLDLAAIYRGEQLQLVVYLNAAMEIEQLEHPDKEVLPAGILYYHLDDPIVEASARDTDEMIADKIQEALRLRGLVNSDTDVIEKMDHGLSGKSKVIPVTRNKDGSLGAVSSIATGEEFALISDYVNKIIADMGRSILEGDITARPGNCDYCEFAGVCHSAGLEKEAQPSEKKAEILEKMRDKLAKDNT